MAPFAWPSDPLATVRAFEARRNGGSAGALFAWAAWTVDSLHYLADVDLAFDSTRTSLGDYPHYVIDVAHARWATSGCITALDLCAAGLGRCFCGQMGAHELSLHDVDPANNSNRASSRRARLPSAALRWVSEACADGDYKSVKLARDALTHSRVLRHFAFGSGGTARLKLEVEGAQVPVRELVELATAVATRHVVEAMVMLSVV